MRYHEILLVPATGHFGAGNLDQGPNYGRYFELDIVAELIQTVAEELDNDRIRCRVLELWKAPGLTRERIRLETAPNTISLHFAFGRGQTLPGMKNSTKTWFSDPAAAWLARILAESVTEWAKCSNYHHEMAQPRENNFFPHHAVLIEPFDLAVDAGLYLPRMHALGQAMAATMAEFFLRTDSATRSKPLGAWSNDKKKNDDTTLVSSFMTAVDEGMLESITSLEYPGKTNGDRSAKGKRKAEQKSIPAAQPLLSLSPGNKDTLCPDKAPQTVHELKAE